MPSLNSSKNCVSSLVNITNGRPMTTSLLVAEKFNKRHGSINRAIRNLECSEKFTEHNFVQSEYVDSTGRAHPIHHISKDGFVFLVMGFTGKKAALLKEAYIQEFNRMQRLLSRPQNLIWRESREQSIEARKAETVAIQQYIDYAIAQGSQSAKTYYMNFTKMTHRALFIMAEVSPTPFREILNTMQLSFMTSAEYLVRNTLYEGMGQGLHYKDIYQLAKERVVQFAPTVGVTPLYLPEPSERIPQNGLPVFAQESEASSMISCKECR
jgi:Rha family phage regulatory protein